MNFKSVLNDVCCDNRIKNGVIDLKNEDHVFVLQEYLENAGFDIDIIVEKTAQLFEAGKFPDRQAYNKDGILVTFPSKEYRDRAVNKGTHFAENPKKAQANIFTTPPADIQPEEPKGSVPVDTELEKDIEDEKEDGYEDRTPLEKVVDAQSVDSILTGETPLINYSVDEAKRYGFYNKGMLWYDTEGNLIGEQTFDESRGLIITVNESLLTKVTDLFQSTWNKVKSYFKNTVKSLIDNGMSDLKEGEETLITIPSSISRDKSGLESPQSVDEGALEAIRGNYNEALTVKYVIEKNNAPIDIVLTEGLVMKVVQLDANGKKYIPEVEEIVKEWDNKLKVAAKGKYEQIRSVISLASNDMASYIINSVGKNKGNILQIFVDNKAFLQGAEFKADIRLKVKKSSGGEILDSYSLKMYQSKTVNLSNTTVKSLIKHLCGEDEAESFIKQLKSDKTFKELDYDAKEAAQGVEYAKKNKEDEEFIDQLRKERENARYPLNQYLAQKVAGKLKSFYTSSADNREKFLKNILKLMGFEDTETKFLMALVGPKQVKAGKSQIIDKHPSLDLSDIEIVNEPGKVGIKIINRKTKKVLVNFSAKEGGKFAGFVDVLS